MRVATLAFDVRRGDVDTNLESVRAGLERAARRGVELVVLPEMWVSSFVDADQLAQAVEATPAAVETLRGWSEGLGLAVCGSAFAAAGEGRPPFNRLHLFDRGTSLFTYDKLHLFSPTAETESFSAGSDPPPAVTLGESRVTGVVCYDLRFGGLLERVLLDGAEILCVPAQWPTTRASHWQALCVGRAVEIQGFVLACNRTGTDLVGRRRLELTFAGNSLIVDGAGQVLAQGPGEEGLLVADLDLDSVRELRRRVPVRRDRRDELYRGWSSDVGDS